MDYQLIYYCRGSCYVILYDGDWQIEWFWRVIFAAWYGAWTVRDI